MVGQEIVLCIVGNKIDLDKQRQVVACSFALRVEGVGFGVEGLGLISLVDGWEFGVVLVLVGVALLSLAPPSFPFPLWPLPIPSQPDTDQKGFRVEGLGSVD